MYNELYHHGRLGQRWGVTNGPPYPLSRATVRREYKKESSSSSGSGSSSLAKRRISPSSSLMSYIQKVKAEKKEKEEAEKRKKEEEYKRQHDADKDRVLREGTATEVLQYVGEISNQQLQEALNRISWTAKLEQYAQKESDQGWQAVNSIMKKIGDVKDWGRIGLDILKMVDEASRLSQKDQDKNKNKS